MRAVQVEDPVVEQRGVDGRIDRQVGIANVVVELLDRFRPERGDRPRVVELLGYVRHEPLVARDHHLGRPAPRRDAEQLELERQQVRLAFGAGNVGVDALHERRNDRVPPLVVVAHLGREVAPEAEQAGAGVALELPRAEDLGDGAGGPPPPDLELEQPVAGRRVALGEEQVMLVLRVDVGDPPAVGHDLDRRNEAGRIERLLPRLLGAGHRPAGRQDQRQRRREPKNVSGHHGWTPRSTQYRAL